MEFIEVSAKNVDDAITKACIELQASSDKLEIQIISEGSSGFFGIGSKPAVIRVAVKPEVAAEPVIVEKEPEKKTERQEKKAVRQEPVRKEAQKKEAPKREQSKKEPAKKEVTKKEAPVKAEKTTESSKKQEIKEEIPPRTEEEIAQMKAAAEEFLNGVFKAMELPVEIQMNYNTQNGSLDIDFAGEDMGILIGKRGQTLDSLQYLTSLVVNKDQKEYVRVKLDTENYRKRRKETLENLARNIAYKVKKTRRPVSLEPMNPYERRIIHSALQGNKFVETYSEGNEPYRHVVVAPKR
ncbi:MAG: KH domain-containing protein [Fusicatenibacter sp.]|nr:KH domain-containing protein [Fusicatenibacter sp.]